MAKPTDQEITPEHVQELGAHPLSEAASAADSRLSDARHRAVAPVMIPSAARDDQRSWPSLLGRLMRGEPLADGDTAWAMDQIMRGEATAAQVAGFAVALRVKGETVAEMAGLARAMLNHATSIEVPGPVVDLAGTGGDRAGTVNISTMSAIVAAAAGARVVKGCNRAVSSTCGSADLLEELGVAIGLPAHHMATVAEEVGITFWFAPLFYPALRHAAGPRRELGVATTFNFLGPLASPARPRAQALGVSDPRMCRVLAGVLAERGVSALVFHGDDGLDEITTTTSSTIFSVRDGTVAEERVEPAELGLGTSQPEDLKGAGAAHNAKVARDVLSGADGPVRDVVLVNAAAALAAEEGADGAVAPLLRDGMARAAEAIDSGRARELLDRWIQVSQKLARC